MAAPEHPPEVSADSAGAANGNPPDEVVADEPELSAPEQGPPPAGELRRFVSFRLDQEAFALPLERVERALRMVAVVHIPQAPPWMLGVINMHGQVLPVLDLGQLFGSKARVPHPDQRLLVMSQQPRNVALLVDEIEQVLSVSESRLEPPSGHLAGSPVLAGVLKNQDDLVLVLNPDRLASLDWEQHEELFKALEREAAQRQELDQPR